MKHVRTLIAAAAASTVCVAGLIAQNVTPSFPPGTFIGPTSTQSPYVVPTAAGWEVISLLTAGDSPSGHVYPMVGIPDGLGAVAGRINEHGRLVADDAYMTVVMNHEISSGGALRAHGQTGAFVSQLTVHLNSLDVKRGQDLIEDVFVWDAATSQYLPANGTPASQFSRFCSADLAPIGAFYNRRGHEGRDDHEGRGDYEGRDGHDDREDHDGRGFNGLIFMNGEEAGNEGRAFAHILTGPEKGHTYQLPHIGRMSFENVVAHPDAGDKTLVMALDDSTPGQVYLYVGRKQSQGSPVERAGLLNGALYGIKVTNGGPNYANGATPFESNGAINGAFVLESVADVATGTGAVLQTTSRTRGVTEFARPEDGSWDPTNRRVFYFVTTGAAVNGSAQTSRLYKLTLDSLDHPTGGAIALVVDTASLVGTDGQTARTFDNITVDEDGVVMAQEDPGNTAYIAKTWRIDPAHPLAATQILESDRQRFLSGGSLFLTQDEENSGIIEVTDIIRAARWYERGRRYFLADIQAHYANGPTLVEGGQLYLIASPDKGRPHRHEDKR